LLGIAIPGQAETPAHEDPLQQDRNLLPPAHGHHGVNYFTAPLLSSGNTPAVNTL
jgi:hypothetical protein